MSWVERRRAGAQFGTVAFGNGTFVASGEDAQVVTSPDGVTWTEHTVGAGSGPVIFTGTQFVLRRNAGNYTSSDGLQWTLASSDDRNVAGFFNGSYISFGWPLRVSTSSNLTQWTRVFEPLGADITGVAVGVLPTP